MVEKRRKLGKGLNELLSTTLEVPEVEVALAAYPDKVPALSHCTEVRAQPAGEVSAMPVAGLHHLPVEYVTSSAFQPRLNIQPDALEQLAESIKAQGILQPIVVRPKGENHYEIVAGERRWRAAQLAGLHIIPALVREIPDEAALAIALIENIQRENLNAIEEAKALKRLADDLQLTHLQVAEAIGKSRTSVTNLVRLLTLNEEVQGLLESKSLEMGHARALLGVRGPLQTQVAKTVVARGLSVRETERIINKLQENMGSLRPKVACDPNIQRLEEDLADKLGATVVIRHSNKKGQGTLMIRYSDVDQLEGILAHLK